MAGITIEGSKKVIVTSSPEKKDAPTEGSGSGTPTSYIGKDNQVMLTTPDAWVKVVINGVEHATPAIKVV